MWPDQDNAGAVTGFAIQANAYECNAPNCVVAITCSPSTEVTTRMRMRSRLVMSVVLVFATVIGVSGRAVAQSTDFDGLLARYVSIGSDGVNRVDYRRWKNTGPDVAALDAFIAAQQREKPSGLKAPQQLAFWANLYNAITLKVILERYPVASIRDIKSEGVWLDPKAFLGPWVTKRVTVEGRKLSLDDIEHAIMRPTFKDPRVHYAVNCASIGCPNLKPKAWRAETLEADLDAAARAFINHPRAVSIGNDGAVTVSSIYKWFKEDFGGTDAGVIAHLKTYAEPALAKRLAKATDIAADRYDWGLNEPATNRAAN